MADTFSNDLRLRLQESGANSGQWGSLLNDTLTNIASAFSLGSEAIPNASTHTITLADDSSSQDEARSLFLKCTGGGQACTVTLAPNTVSKVWIISNETSFTLTFSAGSGANVAVAAGAVKVIVTDGAGSGAAVVDALSGLEGSFSGIDVTGTADVSSQVLVGGNDTIIAENNIRFKSGGGAFIDHNTTGQSITFRTSNASSLDTTAVTIDSSGNLLVGSTTHRNFSGDTTEITVGTTATGATKGGAVTFGSGSGFLGYLAFQESEGTLGTLTSVPLVFKTGNTERMRIDASGNLLVGVSSTTIPGVSNTTAGTSFRGDDGSFFSRSLGSGDANYVMHINRSTADGNILGFAKDGNAVGSIGVLNNNNLRITGDVADHGGLQFGTHSVVPMEAGSDSDGTIDLGAPAARFGNLYLSGGVNFNGSSGGINTANRSFLMDEYEIGTCTISLNTSNGDASLSRQDNATGFYQKTGDICTVQFYSGGLTFSAAGSGTARVTGLPFNNRGGTYDYGVCSVTHNTATTTDIQNGYTAPNHNFITLTQRHATASGIWRTSGVRYFMFSITYLTT